MNREAEKWKRAFWAAIGSSEAERKAIREAQNKKRKAKAKKATKKKTTKRKASAKRGQLSLF